MTKNPKTVFLIGLNNFKYILKTNAKFLSQFGNATYSFLAGLKTMCEFWKFC